MENILHLCGDIAAQPLPSHESHGIVFYTFPLSVQRLSGAEDLPNIVAPEVMLHRLTQGTRVRVFGQIRSYSRRTEKGSHLILSAWAKSIDPAPDAPFDNRVTLSGQVIRPPIYRCTPYGREITDIMLKCDRPVPPQTPTDTASTDAESVPCGFAGCTLPRGRCDYIPCVTWGSVARLCAAMEVGTPVTFTGRFQSRPYTKIINGQPFNRVAYEVSVAELRT